MTKNFMSQSSRLLRAAFLSGLVLTGVFGGGLIVLYTALGGALFPAREAVTFHRLLQEYDFRLGQMLAMGRPAINAQQLDSLSQDLDHLETRIEGVENWLSVLRRRRELIANAAAVPGMWARYAQLYREASMRALRDFPFSEPLVAVAAAAVIHGAAITREREEELRGLLPRLTESRFVPMRLSLHVLLGDFHGPERAKENLLEDGGLSLDVAISTMGQDAHALLASLVILRILEGETWEALSAIQGAMAREQTSPDFVRLAAEFFYDFGNPIRAAELFHMLPEGDEEALSRQADSLWLADYAELARHFWALLATPRMEAPFVAGGGGSRDGAALKNRALYNLAITAESAEEAAELFERLVRQGGTGDTYRELGLIHFTRSMDPPRAVAFLEAERGGVGAGYVRGFPLSALIDLEILRRRMEMGEAGRIAADIWTLLNRYPTQEGLYQWAAWFFGLQRNIAETDALLGTAERHGFTGTWTNEHQTLRLIREGHFDAAIRAMETMHAESPHWAVSANLGRVLEARNAAARALEHYQRALYLLMETEPHPGGRRETASMLQLRIARCLRTLGRIEESRRALLLALELNPDNLNARLELGRM